MRSYIPLLYTYVLNLNDVMYDDVILIINQIATVSRVLWFQLIEVVFFFVQNTVTRRSLRHLIKSVPGARMFKKN